MKHFFRIKFVVLAVALCFDLTSGQISGNETVGNVSTVAATTAGPTTTVVPTTIAPATTVGSTTVVISQNVTTQAANPTTQPPQPTVQTTAPPTVAATTTIGTTTRVVVINATTAGVVNATTTQPTVRITTVTIRQANATTSRPAVNRTTARPATVAATQPSTVATIVTTITTRDLPTDEPIPEITTKAPRRAIDEFPPDFFSEEVRNSGGVIVHFLIFIYVCLALAIVCDTYFLGSLEFISKSLNLPSDIAGATFMAMGTSAPELFTSVIGVFITGSDIGTGTIVGSAVFNLIAIPAVCGFAAHFYLTENPKITSFPIIRDTIYYILTIIALVICIKDNSVDWIESVALIGMFAVYLIIMFYNAQFAHLIKDKANEYQQIVGEDNENSPLMKGRKKSPIEDEEARYNEYDEYSKIELVRDKNGYREVNKKQEEPEEDEEESWIDSNCFCKWLMMPVSLLFKLTLPKPTKYCFAITFTLSILWIAGLTYIAVWMVTIIGYTIGIPDTVSGITILAAGTSIPELISSFLVVKKRGAGDMAICNSLGSNIFDILFCLGVPWLLQSLVFMISRGSGISTLMASAIPIQSQALPFTAMTLLATCALMMLTLRYCNWRLGLSLGVTCTVIYLIFVAGSTIMELSIV